MGQCRHTGSVPRFYPTAVSTTAATLASMDAEGKILFLDKPAMFVRVKEEGRARCYWDPQLASDSGNYINFVKDSYAI